MKKGGIQLKHKKRGGGKKEKIKFRVGNLLKKKNNRPPIN